MGAKQTPAAVSWFFSGRRDRASISQAKEYSQGAEEGFRVVLALVDRGWSGAALQKEVDRLPGAASGVFDGERDVTREFNILTDEAEIGCTLGYDRRAIGATARKPDVVDVQAGHRGCRSKSATTRSRSWSKRR